MPAPTVDPVNAALRTALSNESTETTLDSQLAGSSKKILLSNIEFESAGTYQSTILDKLKLKYVVLKSADTPQPSKPEANLGNEETLKLAEYELYPLEAVQLGWNNCDWSVGAGMVNMGNTCYLNSTLQALFHVPALVNWLMSDKEHAADCQDPGGTCIICAMRKTLQESQQRNANSIRPLLIYNKLRLVCRHLIPGRQEDAHEFLRYLVEAMEKAYLSRFSNHTNFDSRTKETTPLNQILGGYLRSAVRCLRCGHVSTTFQHFQDLLLDIRKAQTLDEALELYFSREKLDDESYQCEACQKKVPATKQFSVERAPMVLCIQLKRFSISNNKITKHVTFRQRLDLTKYARHRPNVPLIYRLVALVTHMGPTVSCGHYTAVAQAPSGNFYQFDDSMVRLISHQAVFNTNAYIMLYELESPPYSQKSTTNKLKVVSTLGEKNGTASSSSSSSNNNNIKINNNGRTPKTILNGIGFTSDKVYGPELPPTKSTKTEETTVIGNSSNLNGSSIMDSPPTSSESDSDIDNNVILLPCKNKSLDTSNEQDISSTSASFKQQFPTTATTARNKSTSSPLSSPNVSTSLSSLSSPEYASKENKSASTVNSKVTKSLVPYESDDTTSSDDSNHSASGKTDSRVSTKAAVGDWQVTSSTDINQEPSSKGGSWEASRGQQNTVNELFKMSHNGYSAPVSTWNSTKSQLVKEVNNERREERKRNSVDPADQGKIKQPKLNSNNHYKSNPDYNPIQEYHNSKNWNNHNHNGGHFKFYGNRNRQFHQRNYSKNYRKNFRYRQ